MKLLAYAVLLDESNSVQTKTRYYWICIEHYTITKNMRVHNIIQRFPVALLWHRVHRMDSGFGGILQ